MGVLEELVALEQRGAKGMTDGSAADFCRGLLRDDAALVVPGMVLDKPTFLAGLESEPEMRSLHIEEPRVIALGADSAILLYRAVARLPDGTRWTQRMNSTYVKQGGEWKLAFHQQTPEP